MIIVTAPGIICWIQSSYTILALQYTKIVSSQFLLHLTCTWCSWPCPPLYRKKPCQPYTHTAC